MLQIFAFMLLALGLGLKHSYDADHLIAVSNTLHRVKSVKSGIKIGFSWALGHMAAAAIITIILYLFRETISNNMMPYFEKVIGIMLIILGLLSLKKFLAFHSHKHSHGNVVHSHSHFHAKHSTESHMHRHMLGIGIIQGLASNDELLLLFTASLAVTSIGVLILALGFFSIGVVLGVISFTIIFSYPLIKINSEKVNRIITFVTGSIGISYGVMMLF